MLMMATQSLIVVQIMRDFIFHPATTASLFASFVDPQAQFSDNFGPHRQNPAYSGSFIMKFARWGACALAAVLAAPALANGDVEAGRVKANTCMGCHGIPNYNNVYPTYRVPKLGGQNPQLVISALKAYKSGERPHKTMQAQAANLSEQDMADIAAYLAKAPEHKDSHPGGGTNSENEKARTCFACHGPNGAKPTLPDAPALAGQYANYLEHALTEYKEGKRKNAVMSAQAAALSREDIKELAAYFNSQVTPLYTPSVHGAEHQ